MTSPPEEILLTNWSLIERLSRCYDRGTRGGEVEYLRQTDRQSPSKSVNVVQEQSSAGCTKKMAKIEKLDDYRKGDRLTTHPALGEVEQSQVAGGCLSSDQLADVAAGYCSAEERKAALLHFRSCSTCFNAWVAISFSLAAMESGSPLKKKTPAAIFFRGLVFLVIAFAVAASVVLFVNVMVS